jgi:alkanesulfonate monooxygenase SsuD/methylene tetrahydromethanopterin reductase-like flavin-dependent oxidoreductase (luciferase family)
VETYPKPVQQPLPIFMAGHADGTFRRLARFGHGWIDSTEQPDSIQSHVDKLRQYAAEAGRGDVEFEVARQFYISLAPTEEEAKANHAATLTPPTRVQDGSVKVKPRGANWEQSIIGSTSQIRDRLIDYVSSGVTEICVIFYYPDVESGERQMRLFAEEIMPALT